MIGRDSKLSITMINKGNTPAIRFQGKIGIHLLRTLPPQGSTQRPDGTPIVKIRLIDRVQAIPQDGNVTISLGARLTEEQLRVVNERREYLTIFGKAVYLDLFWKWQATRFCYYYEPSDGEMVACPGHNTMYDIESENRDNF